MSLAAVEIEADGAGAKLRLTEHGIYLDGEDTPEIREHGTNELIDAFGERSWQPRTDERKRTGGQALGGALRALRGDADDRPRRDRRERGAAVIQDDLHFSTSSLAWVVNAYLIAFGGLLLLAGRLGDLIGRRLIFLLGVGLFTAASLLCGLAHSQALLIAARFLQGVGGAMTSAVILGMIVTMFPDPRERARAIGVYAFVASAGGSVGLLAGGVITQSLNWHWIFFVNLPIGIATAVIAGRLLEHDRGLGFGAGADVPGAVLIACSLMLGAYTIVGPAANTAGAPDRRSPGAGSLALLGLFLAREATARNPLVALRSSASATSPAPTRSRSSRLRACSACSSSARSTCAGCSAMTRCRSASHSCP